MPVKAATPESLQEAAALIRAGHLVAFPTETVYGLGADAFQPQACAAIFEAKGRPAFDPLIVHLGHAEQLQRLAMDISEAALRLAARYWPGPLTLVLKKRPEVPGIVTSGLDTVACRVPAHPAALRLLDLAGTPLAAPSANPFGFLSPTTAVHVEEQLGGRVPLILDGGPCSVGLESSILDLSGDEPVLLREGGRSLEELEQTLGQPITRGPSVLEKPLAPGQLASHYAPRHKLRLLGEGPPQPGDAYLGQRAVPAGDWGACEALSPTGDLCEAAANLFAALHRLDASGAPQIWAELAPEQGLGRAINDRLRKAAAPQGASK